MIHKQILSCFCAELALIKLMELFNHSSVTITKRYIGNLRLSYILSNDIFQRIILLYTPYKKYHHILNNKQNLLK